MNKDFSNQPAQADRQGKDMPSSQDSFALERDRTYDRIIAAVDKKANAIAPLLIVDIHTMAPGAVRQSAEREAWSLLGKGLRHLKSGAPGGKPGLFTEAVSRASLRNAPLAASYNVAVPKFESVYINLEFDSGAAEAVFYARRLLEALEADRDKSTQILQNHIAASDAAAAFGVPNAVTDPELSKIFDAVKKSAGASGALPGTGEIKEGPGKEDIAALRRQAMMSLTFLKDAYAEAGDTLKKEIDAIVRDILTAEPEPKPARKKPPGTSFDL
jgi:hypothetical protein